MIDFLGMQQQLNTPNNRIGERQKRIDETEAEKCEVQEKMKRKERDIDDLTAELDEKRAQCEKSEKTRARIQGNKYS